MIEEAGSFARNNCFQWTIIQAKPLVSRTSASTRRQMADQQDFGASDSPPLTANSSLVQQPELWPKSKWGLKPQGTLGRRPCESSPGDQRGEAWKWKHMVFTVQWTLRKLYFQEKTWLWDFKVKTIILTLSIFFFCITLLADDTMAEHKICWFHNFYEKDKLKKNKLLKNLCHYIKYSQSSDVSTTVVSPVCSASYRHWGTHTTL